MYCFVTLALVDGHLAVNFLAVVLDPLVMHEAQPAEHAVYLTGVPPASAFFVRVVDRDWAKLESALTARHGAPSIGGIGRE